MLYPGPAMGALHLPNIGGELDADIGDNAGGLDLTLSSPALAAVGAIASPDYIWICVDPDGIHGAPEWMKVTALVAGGTSGTVTRGEQGSTARAHKAGVEWVHTLAPSEVDGAAQVYFYDGTDYVLTGGRIFIGSVDPATEGFTLVDGDQWEQT